MGATLSILWRLVFTLVTLVFLASCGIAQSPPTASLPAASASVPTALAIPAVTPTLSPSPTATAPARTSTPASPTTPTNPTQPARLTVKLADDGKTLTLQVGDQFLLDLDTNYVWQVTVSDTSIVNHVPNTGGKDNQGLFATYRQGSATLTANGTPLCYNTVPRCLMPSRSFSLRINIRSGSNSGLTITFADNGKTIPLVVGQTFLLNLGQDYDWTVTVDDQNIVGRALNITIPKGAQGAFEAKRAGTTAFHATGIIICPPGQVCIQIALEFHVQLVVK